MEAKGNRLGLQAGLEAFLLAGLVQIVAQRGRTKGPRLLLIGGGAVATFSRFRLSSSGFVRWLRIAIRGDGEAQQPKTPPDHMVRPPAPRSPLNEPPAGDPAQVPPTLRSLLDLAEEEAQSFHHQYIGTEHLLLGLLREDDAAAKTLRALGASQSKARRSIEYLVGRGGGTAGRRPALTPRAKSAIDLTQKMAQDNNEPHPDSRYLLLALLLQRDGIAAKSLKRLGVDLDKAQTLARDSLRQDQEHRP